ncbi:MAG: linear amide C-N hydrolase [Thermomicrobiales bacterium]|nr:linear amide C-N hydrolase [Thermomicrobiales bacterium]
MCTRALWPDANGAVVVGRNMDWVDELDTALWVLPRGQERTDALGGQLTWTSKYGSVVASQHDLITADGINEAGLAGHLLWLAESDYGPLDPKGTALGMSVWLQYMLDNFATVAEAVAWMEETDLQVVTMVDPIYGRDVTLHLALDDATGDSAIVEYIDGKRVVHHGREFTVMTNSPTFDEQLANVKRYVGFGGDLPIPGSTEANDRFVRTAFYLDRLPQPNSESEAVAAILSIMRNAAQPFGAPDPARPNISTTVWRTAADLTTKRYVFESCYRPNVIWVDLDKLDFTAGAPSRKLDVTGVEWLVGDVSEQFQERPTLQFLPVGPASQTVG